MRLDALKNPQASPSIPIHCGRSCHSPWALVQFTIDLSTSSELIITILASDSRLRSKISTACVEGLIGSLCAPESVVGEEEGRKSLANERAPYGRILLGQGVGFVVETTVRPVVICESVRGPRLILAQGVEYLRRKML